MPHAKPQSAQRKPMFISLASGQCKPFEFLDSFESEIQTDLLKLFLASWRLCVRICSFAFLEVWIMPNCRARQKSTLFSASGRSTPLPFLESKGFRKGNNLFVAVLSVLASWRETLLFHMSSCWKRCHEPPETSWSSNYWKPTPRHHSL